ncbi:MAG: hypothetical protein NTZ19_02235 [Bacteroidetes bacterium]|nr:hypothetical protein [Bacteroidota bacterium]
MDLDQFKTELKTKLATDHINRSDSDIEQLLKKKTVSFIDKIKKSLWFEIIIGFILNFGFVYAAFDASMHSMRTYFGVFSVLMYLFLFFLIYLLIRTNKIKSSDQTIKENLSAYILLIDEFIKRYLQLTMALIPISIIFAGYLGYTDGHTDATMNAYNSGYQLGAKMNGLQFTIFISSFIIFMSLGIYGMYHFTKWYLKKLYGNYLSDLKNCIRELEN